MAIKKFNPTSPGRRSQTVLTFDEISDVAPEKSLLRPKKRTGARNNYGRITTRHKGGGHKQRYRLIDFRRDKDDIPAKVASIEYDPNRSARIALLHYVDGEKRYILAATRLKIGDVVISGSGVDISDGNSLPLENIPLGSVVHNIELRVGKGGQLVRSAGSSAQIVAKEGRYAHVKLQSGEVRLIHLGCRATIGEVGNSDHANISIGKAGRSRWLGIRPSVRGVAMNPVDHPHGGGEGKTSGGRHPISPWGIPTKGYKTRSVRKSNKMIVRKRRIRKR